MLPHMTRTILGMSGCFLVFLVACGPDKPPPQPQPQPTATPEPQPAPEPEPTPEPEPDDAEGAGGAAAEAAKPVEKPKPSGRPAILVGPSAKIASTFGATPGSVLKLKSTGKGPISLKLPEFALSTGYNIEFKTLGANPPKHAGLIGDVARIQLNRGDKLMAEAANTKGDDFELRWPLYDKLSVNLAVGTTSTDDQGAETAKINWTVIAPKTVDEGSGEAYFHLTVLGPVTYFHATSAAPTETAAAP
jgi:hypothetical protein